MRIRTGSVHGTTRETVGTQSATVVARWWFEWCSTQQRTEVGNVANARSTQWQAPYPPANERRILTLTMHIAQFPFPLPEGLCHNLHWGCISMALFHC